MPSDGDQVPKVVCNVVDVELSTVDAVALDELHFANVNFDSLVPNMS